MVSSTHCPRFARLRVSSKALLVPLCLGVCAITSANSAHVVFVNKNATGTVHDGASWTTAYNTVYAAVNAAHSGDEMWVAAPMPAAPAYVEKIARRPALRCTAGSRGRRRREASEASPST